VGRPFGYVAAIGGAAGVNRAIGLLVDEIQRDMAMLGISQLSELDSQRLFRFSDGDRAGSSHPNEPGR
jgi:L-lactate dehydrogenase (cytochrome)